MTFYVRDHTHRICIEADIHSHILAHVLRLSLTFFSTESTFHWQCKCSVARRWIGRLTLKKKKCFLRPINFIYIKKYFLVVINGKRERCGFSIKDNRFELFLNDDRATLTFKGCLCIYYLWKIWNWFYFILLFYFNSIFIFIYSFIFVFIDFIFLYRGWFGW